MKRLRHALLALLILLVFVRPGNGCSFSDEDDPSTQHSDPDAPYSSFVRGRIGVLQPGYRIRHLVVAYNTLNGRGLTPAEQAAAIDVDRFYNMGASYTPSSDAVRTDEGDTFGPGLGAWQKVAGDTGLRTRDRQVPGQPYVTFTNCLDDAFAHAAATLSERRASYARPGAPDSPEIQDWLAGQRAVFSNCESKGQMPQAAPAGAPLWLRQDRAYQFAAAQFYSLDYDAALASFRAIAGDHASPHAQLARYVTARVLIRRASVPYEAGSTREQTGSANAGVLAHLAEARDQLQSILRDPTMSRYHIPAQHLLDYVMLRLDPSAQAEELARRLTQPPAKTAGPIDLNYRQNVIDLTVTYNSLPLYTLPIPAPGGSRPVTPARAPLLHWIDDLSGGYSPDMGLSLSEIRAQGPATHQGDALAAWRNTHALQWLVAALALAQPGGGGGVEMTEASRDVPASSPAYASVSYNRLRLEAAAALAKPAKATAVPVYDEVTGLLAKIEQTEPRSTINLFADIQSSVAPTLEAFLKSASRITPVNIQAEPGEGYPVETASSGSFTTIARPEVTLCGVQLNTPQTLHLDDATALILNQRMPVRLLRDAALSPVLVGNLRFQLAHMAWTRAVLLDDSATARSLAPYLAGCQPAFKPWLDQYNAASTPQARHVLGLLAMMRFTSTEPTVRSWNERDFAAYDDFRDNWWCAAHEQVDPPNAPPAAYLFSQPLTPGPDLPFLTQADRTELQAELTRLQAIPGASDYFAQQALAWVKANPNDPHNADVLGFAMRVVRNACRSDATQELNHQLFDTLHRRYPKSEWATRYTTWE